MNQSNRVTDLETFIISRLNAANMIQAEAQIADEIDRVSELVEAGNNVEEYTRLIAVLQGFNTQRTPQGVRMAIVEFVNILQETERDDDPDHIELNEGDVEAFEQKTPEHD